MDSSTLLRIPLATYIGTEFQHTDLIKYENHNRSHPIQI